MAENVDLAVPAAANAANQVRYLAMDTAGLAPKTAMALWQESIGVFYDARPHGEPEARFHFFADASHLGEAILTRYTCKVHNHYDRSPARIGRDGLDHVTLQVILGGRHGRREAASTEYAEAGDVIIADLAQSQATAAFDLDTFNLTFPRRMLAPLLKAPDEHNLRVVPGKAPLTALLRNHLASLHREAPRMSHDAVEAIIQPTLELAAAALNMSVAEENAAAVRLALTGQIRRYIDEHVADPSMSAETVAAAFGISLRKLYYLFEPYGGVSSYVTVGRLWRARAMLLDPHCARMSIADIAESCGFAYRTNFVRAFRKLFGVTPREARAHAAEGRRTAGHYADGRNLWHWIRQLR
jgi:AraC-like DNA-binding protein